MNVDPRRSQAAALAKAASDALPPSPPCSIFTAVIKSAATISSRRASAQPDQRINFPINFIIAVCGVASLLLLLAGPEFTSTQT